VLSLAVASAFTLVAALFLRSHRREQALRRRLAGLAGEMRDLSTRLELAEQEVARAAVQGEVAEGLLVEKGVADEDDVEAMRARHDAAGAAGYVRFRDGDLH
jgi:hypothetical protein